MRKQKKKIKTLFEEVQLDAGRVEARVVQDGSKHITKCLNSPPPPFFLSNSTAQRLSKATLAHLWLNGNLTPHCGRSCAWSPPGCKNQIETSRDYKATQTVKREFPGQRCRCRLHTHCTSFAHQHEERNNTRRDSKEKPGCIDSPFTQALLQRGFRPWPVFWIAQAINAKTYLLTVASSAGVLGRNCQ